MGDPSPAGTARIVLGYRRNDVAHAVDRIADRLRERFGRESVFVDIDSIEAGDDWVDRLKDALNGCDALIVMMGPQWLTLSGANGRKLDDPDDPVRMEIRTALERKIVTFPILIDGATMPPETELPPDIRGLARILGHTLSRERFEADVETVMDRLDARLDLSASFGRRVLAFLADLGVVLAVASLLGPEERPRIAILIFALYHVIFVAMKRRTLGKMLFGIRVDLPEDVWTRWVRALFRSTVGYSFSIFSGIGLLHFLLHPKHVGFHDLLFSTKVLRDRKLKWGFLRGVDHVSQRLDERVSALLKGGAFGAPVAYLVKVFWGLEPLLRGLTAGFDWVVGKATSLAGGKGTSTVREVDGVASQKSLGLAALTIAPAALLGAALSVASIAVYDSIVPRQLRILDRSPVPLIVGSSEVVKGNRVLVLMDARKSTDRSKIKRAEEMVHALERSGMKFETPTLIDSAAGGVIAVLNALKSARMEGIDAVVWISDFEDKYDAAGVALLGKELEARHLRLYLATFSELVALARETDGDIVALRLPPTEAAAQTGGAGVGR